MCLTPFALLLVLQPPADAPRPIGEKIAAMVARVDAAEIEKTVRDLVGFGTRHPLSAGADEPGHGTSAARDYLEEKLRSFAARSGGRLRVERKTYTVPSRRLRREVTLVNIVATLRGVSDPERTYVVGGHYDSINGNPRDAENPAPGANDDGSGTAVVLEACRVMCEQPFAATIAFVCYDGEEQGLLGSSAHAAELADAEALVDGMITNDIVGNTLGMDGVRRDGYVRCFSYSPRGNDSGGRSLARAATRAAREHVDDLDVMLVYRGDRYGRGGDHAPFHRHGYPAVRFTEPREDYSRQHQDVTERDGRPYGDLPDYMDFAYTAKVCAVNVASLAELASAPRPPERVRARGSRTAYDVRLFWQPVEAEDAGYEAVWRATTAADWTGRARLAADALQEWRSGWIGTVLPGLCLDDLVVGVRSVAPDGSRSRVAVPPEPDAFRQRPARRRRR